MPIKSRYLFVASMDVDPDKEALFNEVYDTEHVPNLVKVPGAQAVARMEGEPFAMSIGGEEKQVGRNQAGARHIVGVPVVGQEIERRRMGRRGARVRLPPVIDLKVPANAEIVIEGYLGLDPATYEIEGPFAEVTGYVAATARRNRQSASPASPTATIRSCAERSKARCPAVSPRTACARRSCAPRRPGTCSTGPGCRASPTCGARQCKRASIFLCRSNKPIAAKPSR